MKNLKNKTTYILAAAGILSLASCGDKFGGGGEHGSYSGEIKTIILDGGGDISNFNTTASMVQSEANPYPYNTLETLCNEWMEMNPQYKVVINKTSANGDRTVLVPQLNNHTAPDITYQNGTVLSSDIGKDYYIRMDQYFEEPNPYEEGNTRWADIYQHEELAQTMAPDGHYYTTCLEKIPVGIMYNKSILQKVGIANAPQTFGDFVEACRAVSAFQGDESFTAYSTTNNWYAIALESNMFSNILKDADTIHINGVLDQEEFCRAYVKKIWQPDLNASGDDATFEGNRFYEYITKCAELGDVQAPLSYAAHEGFVNGQLAFLQVTGREIRKLGGNAAINFDWDVMPFPDLSNEDDPNHAAPSLRGIAGLATAWFITKRAEDNNTVEGCVDLLKFLTARNNNNRLIGDLKGGIPLNPASDYEMSQSLQSLVDFYNEDKEKVSSGERCYWGSVNSWGCLGYNYYAKFVKTLQDIQNGVSTVETATKSLAKSASQTITALRIENEYDESAW